jgi:hypothetical protein
MDCGTARRCCDRTRALFWPAVFIFLTQDVWFACKLWGDEEEQVEKRAEDQALTRGPSSPLP